MEKYALIITEKPDAARRIATALDSKGKPKKVEDNGVPYFLAERDRKLVVVPALGHLYTLVRSWGRRNFYPILNFKWEPRYKAERGAKNTKAWVRTISKLSEDADDFIAACDYDIEGSLIGYWLLKYACRDKEDVAKRMKFSTLTKDELAQAYEEPLPHLDFTLIEAGRTRHEVDWLYGVNLSRALTLSARRWSGRYNTLSTGRVQGPTLRFLVKRERTIRTFVPKPYWSINAEVEIKGSAYEVEYEKKKIRQKAEAEKVLQNCKGRAGKIESIAVRKYRQRPPIPFDLGGLQSEAYRLFGYTPRRTSYIAQRLYLEASISYPRTSSQKLPPAINYRAILKALSKRAAYKRLATTLLKRAQLKPRAGKKEDPAHPAVYPTGSLPRRALSDQEKNIWDLIVRRFMAVFGDPAIKQSMKATILLGGHPFYLRGRRVLKEGWMKFYEPYIKTEEVLLPTIKEGETIELKQITREDKFTNPPPRYNPSSLLKKMEEEGIGTKATRADIIQTLYERRYVRDQRIEVTALGFDIVEILRKHCPRVISVRFTRELEEKMEQVQTGSESREDALVDAVDQLKPMLEALKKREVALGEALSEAVKKARMEERIVGNCSSCGTGKLIILYSRKTGKRFIGCTNYFEGTCETSFPLPQKGTVKSLRIECTACGWPIVAVRIKDRRPWRLCFNPDCPRKEERKKYGEMQNLRKRRSE
ncbi:MAG: DNA topoisomerase I [Candidatus Bathyarchaeota archaeon]|nr:MAG: DNA topoisomerase I [Candidatus Bathyarchaeota archaeon]